MAYLLRRLVSKQKRRYQQDGYDLDLAYITPRIIAMALPGTGKEALYRNRLPDVARFLAQYHGEHARVYNLCAEYSYECDALCGDVVTLPLHDHQAAPLHAMQAFCESAAAYLDADERNVLAVHCKAGKGRTGQLICGLLLYQGICSTPEEALSLYGERRTHNHKGVTIPSQRRYVEYFGQSLSTRGLSPPPPRRVRLATLTLSGLPEAMLHECIVALYARPPGGPLDPAPLAVLVAKGNTRKAWGRKWRRIEHSPLLAVDGQFATVDFSPMYGAGEGAACVEGDVKVQVFHGAPRRANSLFYCWLNTAFLEAPEGGAGGGAAFSAVRWQLDRVKPRVPPNVLLELHFDDPPPQPPATHDGAAAAAAAAGVSGQGANAVRGQAANGAGGVATPCSSDDGASSTPRAAHGGTAAAAAALQPFDVEAPAARDAHGGARRRGGAAPDPFLLASSGVEPALDRERWHAHERRRGVASGTGSASGGEHSRSGRGGGGARRGEASAHGSDVGSAAGAGSWRSDAVHAADADDAGESAGEGEGGGSGGRAEQRSGGGSGGGRGGSGTAPTAVLQQELVWVGASS